jgi:cell division protein FtsW (lipid II flippase)
MGMTEAVAGIIGVVFTAFCWAIAIYAISRTRWRPIGWILVVIAVDRLIFYVKWFLYSRRYDRVHNFIDLANRFRRKPVSGLIVDQSNPARQTTATDH